MVQKVAGDLSPLEHIWGRFLPFISGDRFPKSHRSLTLTKCNQYILNLVATDRYEDTQLRENNKYSAKDGTKRTITESTAHSFKRGRAEQFPIAQTLKPKVLYLPQSLNFTKPQLTKWE